MVIKPNPTTKRELGPTPFAGSLPLPHRYYPDPETTPRGEDSIVILGFEVEGVPYSEESKIFQEKSLHLGTGPRHRVQTLGS